MAEIKYDDFAKLDLKVGRIESASRVPDTNKLLTLLVDLGSEKRQLLAGIAEAYPPEDLVGKDIIVLVNLEPKLIRGLESNGMLLCADPSGSQPVLLTVEKNVPSGTIVR